MSRFVMSMLGRWRAGMTVIRARFAGFGKSGEMQPSSVRDYGRITCRNQWQSYAQGRVASRNPRRVLAMIEPELCVRLGLGDLSPRTICHGYSTCCECSTCLKRSEAASSAFLGWLESDVEAMPSYMPRQAPKQPWEARRAA